MTTRPLSKAIHPVPRRLRLVAVLRRGHLYLGLFLFPWAILYGFTAFLFNHPTFFSDQATTTFGRDALAGTPLEDLPTAADEGERLVAKLNELRKPPTPYALAGEARYNREFAFATVKSEGQTVSVLLDVKSGCGTVRVTPGTDRPAPEQAPFATPPPRAAANGQVKTRESTGEQAVLVSDFATRFRDAVPAILERSGFTGGEVIVTSVPDVVVPVNAGGRTWVATYNRAAGTVTGTPPETKPAGELGWRRFMLRLHTAHGYPDEPDVRWFWAVVVDAMAFTMCFWGLTGLVMWSQVKATRRPGAVVLALSAAAAAALGFAMHAEMTR